MCGYSGITHEYHVITCVNVLSHAQTPHFHASQSPGIDEKIPFTLVKSRYCVCFVDILVMARLLSKLCERRAFSAPNVQTVILSLCYCYGVKVYLKG